MKKQENGFLTLSENVLPEKKKIHLFKFGVLSFQLVCDLTVDGRGLSILAKELINDVSMANLGYAIYNRG